MRVFRRSQSFGGATVPSHTSARTQSSAQHDLPPNDSGSVLVAVNGKERGWDALEWAAAEAASRQCALRIVHAFRSSPLLVDPLGTLVDEWKAIEAASGVLTDAVNHARAVAPTLQVTAHMQEGSTTTAILREGSRGDGLPLLHIGRSSSNSTCSVPSRHRSSHEWTRSRAIGRAGSCGYRWSGGPSGSPRIRISLCGAALCRCHRHLYVDATRPECRDGADRRSSRHSGI